ncbi:MAG: TIGR03086 family metal-binding protein [Acidimicrobiales bacterium]
MTSLPDLRPELASSYEQAAAVVSAVQPGQLGSPTPCRKMDVSALIDHLVFAARRGAGLGRGETPAAGATAPHLELSEATGLLGEARVDAKTAWADDASLERSITMPWGETYPGAALAGMYFGELATHSWDLAFATGNTSLLDDKLGAAALSCMQASIAPEHRTPEGEPFGPEVEAPDDATAWERLAAFMGRQPR